MPAGDLTIRLCASSDFGSVLTYRPKPAERDANTSWSGGEYIGTIL